MKKLTVLVLLLVSSLYAMAQERPYTKAETYFSGTNYELQVYHIYGRKDGKTMLIIGGIQGDEPGGFLSADAYADIQLAQGNLIVVPRANFKSVILFDRAPDGDMNRRFLDVPDKTVEMDKVVSVIKTLMGEADVFLNLHDGWGYHNPVYIDDNRNPKKFGQSVITDADSYTCDNGRTIDLATPAKDVVKTVNDHIDDPKYYLHYFDTDTSDPTTQFKDMRKTATYWALRKYCIPAFGIETSKNLPNNELKVRFHNYAVNEFMRLYGIVPEVPSVFMEKPKMEYAVILVNDEPVKVDNGGTLTVRPGDVCEVVHVESNYDRGVSADLIGYGSLNDMNVKYAVRNNSVVQFRKDSLKMGSININVDKKAEARYASLPKTAQKPVAAAQAEPVVQTPVQPIKPVPVPAAKPAQDSGYTIVIKHNGRKDAVKNGDTYEVKTGDRLVILGIYQGGKDMDLPVNLKGYYTLKDSVNSGDDRGDMIYMRPSRFMAKYAEDDAKMKYPVVVKQDGAEIAKIWLMMK